MELDERQGCIQKYIHCKLNNGGAAPECREFLKDAGVTRRQLEKLFGSSAYSKLQEAAGDVPNKLKLERMPFDAIMRQYGELVTDVGAIPPAAEWEMRGLKPSEAGLGKPPHRIKWSEMKDRFVKWVTANNISEFEEAIAIINPARPVESTERAVVDATYAKLLRKIREWMPARGRNSEAEYKIELRMHLEALRYSVKEEFGESSYDLLVQSKYAIEIKKKPILADYDRLFGQVARHLEHQSHVVVLILDANRGDKYDQFVTLVDKYLNVGGNSVEVIKR